MKEAKECLSQNLTTLRAESPLKIEGDSAHRVEGD